MAAYALAMCLGMETQVRTGSLGVIPYPRGWYVYIGSAVRGMASRVSRHMRHDKPLRWHADYLTRHAQAMGVLCDASDAANECEWARRLAQMNGAKVFPHGFGSSDCYCPGHLIYFHEQPSFVKLLQALYT